MTPAKLELRIIGVASVGFEADGGCENPEVLSPCRYCQGADVNVMNMKSEPRYFAFCDYCGHTGPFGSPIQEYEEPIHDMVLCRRLHQQAFDAAVEAWESGRVERSA